MTDHNHRAIARLQFMGEHESIVGIGYRFKLPSDEFIESKTDEAGYTKTLIGDSHMVNTGNVQETEFICYIKMNSKSITVPIEVQRDDGSWKEIGSFQLEAEKEKNITAQIETIALPFKLELVKGL